MLLMNANDSRPINDISITVQSFEASSWPDESMLPRPTDPCRSWSLAPLSWNEREAWGLIRRYFAQPIAVSKLDQVGGNFGSAPLQVLEMAFDTPTIARDASGAF